MSIDTQLQAVLDEIQTTVLQRHQKYGPTNVSGSPGGPLNGLRVRLHDKLARINNFVDHGGTADFTDDAFRDAFVDVVGYGLIGLLVVDGQWPAETAAPPRVAFELSPDLLTMKPPTWTPGRCPNAGSACNCTGACRPILSGSLYIPNDFEVTE